MNRTAYSPLPFRNYFSFLLALFFVLGLSSTSKAAEISIFGNISRPPKYYLDENKQPTGILVDILHYIGKETGDTFHIKLLPWKRAYRNMLSGKGGIMGLSKNEERLKIIDYSIPMFYDELYLVVLKGKEFPFKTISDLRGKTISVIRGVSFGTVFEEGKNNFFSVKEVSKTNYMFKEILWERVDATLVDRVGLKQILESDQFLKKNKDRFVLLPTPFVRDPNHIGFAKSLNMTGYLSSINKALKKGWETGAIQKIVDRYSNAP